jgi:hypothetical protein
MIAPEFFDVVPMTRTSLATTVPPSSVTWLAIATISSAWEPTRFAVPLITRSVLTSPSMVALPSMTTRLSARWPAGNVMSPRTLMTTRPSS